MLYFFILSIYIGSSKFILDILSICLSYYLNIINFFGVIKVDYYYRVTSTIYLLNKGDYSYLNV
jgi:hypothetical protein